MRRPEYLSPSNIKLFSENREQWYMRYISDNKSPHEPQTQAMSIGSAFDAYVKSHLYKIVNGDDDPRFELSTLFEAQVEAHNRDWAWKHGAYAFKVYEHLGALADLIIELQQAIDTPRFEISVQGIVSDNINGVVLLGKPDCYFLNKAGHTVILDWKVNGYCSKSAVSPKPGYLRLRGDDKKSVHKDAVPIEYHGMTINAAHFLEDVEEEWAAQLATYAWLCGTPIGGDCITAIDQIVCQPIGGEFPKLRVAEHRTRCSPQFQIDTFTRYKEVDQCIKTGHIFTDLSLAESNARCLTLDNRAKIAKSEDDKAFESFERRW